MEMEGAPSSEKNRSSIFSMDLSRRSLIRLYTTPEVNPPSTAIIPLSALSPMEAALSIEKIRNAIFSLLEPSDLLECRLVSSSWLRMATNDKLLKWNLNVIWFTHSTKQTLNLSPSIELHHGTKRWEDFKNLLHGTGSHPFPWSTHLNLETRIGQNDWSKFLDRYGFVVNSLKLTVKGTKDWKFDTVCGTNPLLKFLTKLLMEQMPNLETLVVYFNKTPFVGEIKPKVLEKIKNGSYLDGKQNQNLRFIEISVRTPHEIINALCCLAPNLDELLLTPTRPEAYPSVHGSLGLYKNRLHLPKGLTFEPELEHWDEVNAFEAFLCTEEKISLKTLAINFSGVWGKPDQWPHLCTLVTKISEKSCHSLEEIVLNRVQFSPETVLPQMPKVTKLTLDYGKIKGSVWPQANSIASTFPTLREIHFKYHTSAAMLLCLCKNEEVASVKEIFCNGFSNDGTLLEQLFPNAVVNGLGSEILADEFVTGFNTLDGFQGNCNCHGCTVT